MHRTFFRNYVICLIFIFFSFTNNFAQRHIHGAMRRNEKSVILGEEKRDR